MIDFATEVNRTPLPSIPMNCYNGVVLPPVEQQLTARTYDVVNGARVVQRMMRGGDVPITAGDLGLVKTSNKAMMDAVMGEGGGIGSSNMNIKAGGSAKAPSSNTNSQGSKSSVAKRKTTSKHGAYGAGRGRQIAVNIKNTKKSGFGSEVTGASTTTPGQAASTTGESSGSGATASGGNKPIKAGGSKSQKRKLTEL